MKSDVGMNDVVFRGTLAIRERSFPLTTPNSFASNAESLRLGTIVPKSAPLAAPSHALRRISARASASAVRARSASRLSCSFLPFATATSHLIRPFFR